MPNITKLEDLFYKVREDNIDVLSYINTITGYEIAFWKRKREISIEPMVSIKLLEAIQNKANELWRENNDWCKPI